MECETVYGEFSGTDDDAPSATQCNDGTFLTDCGIIAFAHDAYDGIKYVNGECIASNGIKEKMQQLVVLLVNHFAVNMN